MNRRGLITGCWLAVVVSLVAVQAGAADEERAATQLEEDKRGRSRRKTLAQRIPDAVTHPVFGKSGRLELWPTVGLDLDDPFYDYLLVGGGLGFHILESVAISASGEYFLPRSTPTLVVAGGSYEPPEYNYPRYAARLDLSWAPIYGKMSLLAEQVIHFDLYLSAGGGVLGPAKDAPDQDESTLVWSVALGQRYFLTEWFALKFELRNQFFELNRHPVDGETNETQLESLLTATLGFSFYLPTEVDRGD